MILALLLFLSTYATAIPTQYDGGIIVPERRRFELIIFDGEARNWNRAASVLWRMPLKNARGVPSREMREYNHLWRGRNGLNDVKRVIHNGRVHIIITGNGGNSVAMYDFETRRNVYWSQTNGRNPHDVEYLPVGSGYLGVAQSGRDSVIELYDIRANNRGVVPGSAVRHPGIHGLIWDGKDKLLWAWGSTQRGLKSYRVVFNNDLPRLRHVKTYPVTVPGFYVGVGHGSTPKIDGDKRSLLLAGRDGILEFDLKTKTWSLVKRAQDARGPYRNPKGLSYNYETGELIVSKSTNKIYSMQSQLVRFLRQSEIYKAKWWQHNFFSFPDH